VFVFPCMAATELNANLQTRFVSAPVLFVVTEIEKPPKLVHIDPFPVNLIVGKIMEIWRSQNLMCCYFTRCL